MNKIEDRGSAIRVERLSTIPVGAKGYVKLETNMGVTGWGEINNMDTKVACALAESLGELVVGELLVVLGIAPPLGNHVAAGNEQGDPCECQCCVARREDSARGLRD